MMRTQLYNIMNDLEKMFYEGATKNILVDVKETENGYQVIAEAPGLTKESFDITFDQGYLTIKASKQEDDSKYLLKERSTYAIKRVINFGDINLDDIKAKYENGLLIIDITVLKEEKQKKSVIVE